MVAMKLVSIKNVKHPVSLYIYDTPGDLREIRETAVIFPIVDIIFIVLNGDEMLDENYEEKKGDEVIKTYRDYALKNLEKYQKKRAKETKAEEVPDQGLIPLTSVKVSPSKLGSDESIITPLHGGSKKNPPAVDEVEKYPKIMYVFTHRDKIDSKGSHHKEVVNKNIEKLMRKGTITRNYALVSSKVHTDVHLVFKNEILLKLNTDMLYMT